MSMISTTSVLIDVLGGNQKVAAITGSSANAVSGWRKSRFPAATYLILKTKVKKMGLDAPDTLWAMRAKPRRKAKR